MRSVVVVLPASMCAMMPIFLQRSNGTCLATIPSVSCYAALRPLRTLVARATSPRHFYFTGCPVLPPSFGGRAGPNHLPAIVRKGLIGLGHAMHVVLLLNRCATAIGRVQQLVGQLVDHALFATPAAVLQNPADGQRNPAVSIHLHRHLVVGAAHAAGLYFQHRLGVLHRLLEQLEGLVAALFFKLLHGVIEDGLGGALLPIPHHGVHKLVNQGGLVDRIRQLLALRDISFSRHKSSTKPSGAWRRTSNVPACGWPRLRNPACRAPRDSELPAGPSHGPRGSARSSAPA